MSEQPPPRDRDDDPPEEPSPWRWLLFGCVGCGVFGLCLFTAFVVLAALGSQAAKEDSVAAARRHVQLVKQAEIAAAYGDTAPEFQAATDLKTFEAFVAQQGVLYQASDVSLDQRQVNDDVATLQGQATAEDGTRTPVTFVVVNVAGRWLVRDISIGE